jgi:DNA-binding response OmpR family regulator
MRPKKSILLYCADKELLEVIAYALRLHPYDVAAVCNVKEAMRLAQEIDTALVCGVLLHAQRGDLAGRLIHLLLDCGAPIPLLLVDQAGDLAPVRHADMVLYGRNTKMIHILAAIQVLCRRRSGPNPRRAA